MIQQERQAWNDEQQAQFSVPRPDRVEVVNGKRFTRGFPKRCPWCGRVFFAYAPEDTRRQPYTVDRNPEKGNGVRETCGNPMCWEAEDKAQWERRIAFRAEEAKRRASAKAAQGNVQLLAVGEVM